jgi:hypothetical protein
MTQILGFKPIYKIKDHELDVKFLLQNFLKTQTARSPTAKRVFRKNQVIQLTIHPCRTCKHVFLQKVKMLKDTYIIPLENFTEDDIIREGFINISQYKETKEIIPLVSAKEFTHFFNQMNNARKKNPITEVKVHRWKKINNLTDILS